LFVSDFCISAGIDRIDGINANITINAQVSPNITIRIVPESRSESAASPPPAADTQTSSSQPGAGTFHRSNPTDVSNRAIGLAPEIVTQIRDSVNNNTTTGRPIVIECENTNTNSEIGRVIGEAVTQTFQNLSNQVTGNAPEPETPQREETTSTTVTSTVTSRDAGDGAEPQTTRERTQETTRCVNGQPVERQMVGKKMIS